MRDALAVYGGRLVRWPPDRGMPIRVWVQPVPAGARRGASRGLPPGPSAADWTWAAVTGARDWDGVVPGLRFARAGDSAGAEVRVLWEPPGGAHPGRHPDGPHGHTAVVATSAGVIEGADVTLGVRGGGARASPADVQAVAAHVLGLVLVLGLGLVLVHRAESRSAMAPELRADHVSPRDRAVLRAWYALPPAGPPCR